MALNEAGARHSASDMAHLDNIHNAAVALGASCAPVGESAKPEASEVSLTESAAFPSEFKFTEAAAVNPLVKIISPGRGSSGWYSKEMLQRDGPKIFKSGTLMYINHATEAEEKARPEGNWKNLAAVTEGPAYWDENGKDGPALYAPAKVFSDYAAAVTEKAPYTGVSIRAGGVRDDKALAPDGKPGVITSLTRAESIDIVTRAGRDGKLLIESARAEIPTQEAVAPMADATEVQKLQEAVATQNATIKRQAQRIARSEAREAATAKLATIRFTPEQRLAIVNRCVESAPITAELDLDTAAFTAVMEREIKFAADLIPGGIKVVGQGDTGTQAATPEQLAEAKKQDDAGIDRFAAAMGFGGAEHKVGRDILAEGYRAFEPTYNARNLKESRQ